MSRYGLSMCVSHLMVLINDDKFVEISWRSFFHGYFIVDTVLHFCGSRTQLHLWLIGYMQQILLLENIKLANINW